jgi:hypothetical protein
MALLFGGAKKPQQLRTTETGEMLIAIAPPRFAAPVLLGEFRGFRLHETKAAGTAILAAG